MKIKKETLDNIEKLKVYLSSKENILLDIKDKRTKKYIYK